MSRASTIVGVNSAFLALAVTTAVLRIYVRTRLVKAFGLDDWLMTLATISFILYCTFSLTGVHYGTGKHYWELSEENYATAKMWWYRCYLTYATTMLCCKLSIGWILLRVSVRRMHKGIIYVAASLTVASLVVFFFVCAFQCSPVSYFWDKYTQTGKCIDDNVIISLSYFFSALSILTDFVFALLPAWIVSHLNMKLKTKFALITLMGMGCVASTAVVVRLPALRHIASDDFLHDTSNVAIWSTIEQSLGISAGCLATLQPLAKLVGYKLGLASKPALGVSSRYGSHPLTGGGGTISVRRSISRRTEPFSSAPPPEPDEIGLKLQPGTSGYSAMCYNTSQEELRLDTSGSDDPKLSKGSSDKGLVRTR
ncbi:hypothetical protein VTK26DRAFT_2933 [Humicola hyalothermophila]